MVDEHYHTVLLVFQRITASTLHLLQNSKYTYVPYSKLQLSRASRNLYSGTLRD